ncbi:MAG: zinc finger MYND domain-containing protein [Candidatus Babeliales bacterium]|nr:zinc finger MYND domain-containing protein [Candidatus Babeliales bacterium]
MTHLKKIILLSLIFTFQIYGLPKYFVEFITPNGKKVIIIGDLHNIGTEAQNNEMYEVILSFLNKQEQSNSQTIVLVEGMATSKKLMDQAISVKKNNDYLMQLLDTDQTNFQNIKIVNADLRSLDSNDLFLIYSTFHFEQKSLPDSEKGNAELFFNEYKKILNLTVQEYIQSLFLDQEKLLKMGLLKNDRRILRIENLIKGIKQNYKADDSALSIMKKFGQEVASISSEIADVGFLKYICDNPDKNILLVCGNIHASNIDTSLSGMFTKTFSMGHKIDMAIPVINNELISPARLHQILRIKDGCQKCFKELSEKQRCAKCKTTHYCSRECQAADWKIHKKFCKPAIEPENQAASSSSATKAIKND